MKKKSKIFNKSFIIGFFAPIFILFLILIIFGVTTDYEITSKDIKDTFNMFNPSDDLYYFVGLPIIIGSIISPFIYGFAQILWKKHKFWSIILYLFPITFPLTGMILIGIALAGLNL